MIGRGQDFGGGQGCGSHPACGPGSLLDADPVQELAQLRSLHLRQQAGEEALPIAAAAPQSLLSLFR